MDSVRACPPKTVDKYLLVDAPRAVHASVSSHLSHPIQPFGRLVGREMFSHVFDNGRRFCWKNIHILMAKNDLPYSRVGFVMSKRNVRTSVMRHCIKRKVRALLRGSHECFSGVDIIIWVRSISKQNTRSSVRIQLATVFAELVEKKWS